jgi:hypothetical protein
LENRTYYVGDLCYVLNRDEWDTVCLYDIDPEDPEGFLDPDGYDLFKPGSGRPFFILRTACGDGCYEGSDGKSYCVDSGTMGIIAVDDISEKEKLKEAVEKGLGHLHETDEEVFLSDYDGTLVFGELVEICTA